MAFSASGLAVSLTRMKSIKVFKNNSTIDGAAITDAFFEGVRDNHLFHINQKKNVVYLSQM